MSMIGGVGIVLVPSGFDAASSRLAQCLCHRPSIVVDSFEHRHKSNERRNARGKGQRPNLHDNRGLTSRGKFGNEFEINSVCSSDCGQPFKPIGKHVVSFRVRSGRLVD